MFDSANLVTSHLWLGLSFFMIVIILLNRTYFFQSAVLGEIEYPAGKILLIILFSTIGILGTYWSIAVDNGTINTRAVGVIVSGLIGGPKVGLTTGAIVGVHRFFFMGNFSAEESALITVFQGFLAGMFSSTMKEQKKMWPYAFKVGFSLEALHMFFLLLFAAPYESAVALVEVIALPMLITNPIGIAAFIGIVEDNYERDESLKTATTKTALYIANLTLPILKNGFNSDSAGEIVESISNAATSFDCVAILTNKQVMSAKIKGGDKNNKITAFLEQFIKDDFVEIVENIYPYDISNPIYSGDSQTANAFARKNSGAGNKKIIFTGKIVVPIYNGDVQVASLFLGKKQGNISDSEVALANGLGNLISEQIEIEHVKEQAKLLATAELKALQYQINPHFLFNALNTISYHCRTEPNVAKQLIVYLADYYRHNLSDTGMFISLNEEMQHIVAYVNIEMARFGDRLHIDYAFDENSGDIKLPALIIQPLVENAIKHGIQPKLEGGDVSICVKKHEGYFEIFVTDNGVGMDENVVANLLQADATRTSIGISNVHKRLITIYGPDNGLSITSKKNEGTVVSFKIPV